MFQDVKHGIKFLVTLLAIFAALALVLIFTIIFAPYILLAIFGAFFIYAVIVIGILIFGAIAYVLALLWYALKEEREEIKSINYKLEQGKDIK